jgi:hypothetical protein
LCCLLLVANASSAQESTQKLQSEGNLARTHEIGCVEIASLSSEATPADLFPAARKCFDLEQYQKAIDLYFLASTYARYDTYRVSDRSAHQAGPALALDAFESADEAHSAAYQRTFEMTTNDPKRLATLCEAIRKLGPPTYPPRYMIAHGTGANVGQSTPDGLVADFDADAAWERTLSSFLHCPKP